MRNELLPLRVAILHQGYIPPYRVRFYELLNQREGVEYVVFHGAPPSMIGSRAAEGPFPFPTEWVQNREIRFGSWVGIYQPVLRRVLAGDYDAIVLGHEIKFLANNLLALAAKIRGIPMLYWGFGYHVRISFGLIGESGWVGSVAGLIKKLLVRLADGYLVYAFGGARKLAAGGFPLDRIFVLRNTIDMAEQIKVHDELLAVDPAEIRRELGLRPDSTVFLFVGRLLKAKQADLLIEAVRRIAAERLTARPVEALIIGTGPHEPELKRAAEDVSAVRLLGEVRDPMQVGRCMRVAAAVVVPCCVGLAINHAFAQGRPLITRRHHLQGPEFEYIVDEENGLIVEGGIDALVAALAALADSPARQRRLAEGALRTRDSLLLERMVERFDHGVRATIARRQRGGVRAEPAHPPAGAE